MLLPQIVCTALSARELITMLNNLEAFVTEKFGAVSYDIRLRGGGRGKRAERPGSIRVPDGKIAREAHGKAALIVGASIRGDFGHKV
ncbi:MAG TPA: hypothetical protein VJK53_05730 [Candidatus Paceibacterota bacterium]